MSPYRVATKPTIGAYHHPSHDAWQLVLRGRHHAAAVDALEVVLAGLGADSRIIVDLSEATFIGPGVVATLSRAAQRAHRGAGRVLLVRGPTAHSLPSAITRCDALEPALAAVAAPVAPRRSRQRSTWIALVTTLLGQ